MDEQQWQEYLVRFKAECDGFLAAQERVERSLASLDERITYLEQARDGGTSVSFDNRINELERGH